MRVKTEARREAIVAAATQLFKEMGYERATISELASRYGGSKATLYSYFPSKEELFVAVVKTSAIGHLSYAVKEITEGSNSKGSIEAKLTRFAEHILLALTNNERALAVYRMVIAEAGCSDVGQLFYDAGPSECITALTNVLKNAMQTGQLRTTDPYVLALQFLGLVTAENEIRLYQRNPPKLEVSQIRLMAQRAIEMFLAGAAAK
jgi:AcrR family transcriptional regulator